MPLKALIHIPKTAGTTMNAALAASGPGAAHIERFAARPARLARAVARADWVSGHLPLRDMERLLGAATDRRLALYGLVRDPVAQIASHYNWWYVVYHRGPLSWWRQGAPFRALSRRIRAADPGDPAQVIAQLEGNAPLFLNMQADYLLGTRARLDHDEIRARLARLAHVGLNEDLDALAGAMGVAPPARARNRVRYHFDKRIFFEGPVRNWLEEAHGADLALYRVVREMQGKV